MASREKKPLAPSKSRQKANNDSGSEIKSRKIRLVSTLKNQQLAQDILEAVATGSQLPARLEANLPRRRVLKNLKQKPKLGVAKASLIKGKVTKKVPIRNLKRVKHDVKRNVRVKRTRQTEEEYDNSAEVAVKFLENHFEGTENEGQGTDNSNRGAKANLRTKKLKSAQKATGETETGDCQDKDSEIISGSASKNSLKAYRRGKGSTDLVDKSAKSPKLAGVRRQTLKDRENYIKVARKTYIKEEEDIKPSKAALDDKSSIDLTIDEVIASSMLNDPDIDNQEGSEEKVEGKLTRRKKMLIGENSVPDIEIKKEPDAEEIRPLSDGEYPEGDKGNLVQSAIQLRKRSTTLTSQRSLRNGKLRQHSDSGLLVETDIKKRRRLNSDDAAISETSTEHAQDATADTESCFSETSESQIAIDPSKDDSCSIKDPMPKSFETGTEIESELENNNNSERVDRTEEIGPTLRSKTKAKCTDTEAKNDDAKAEDTHLSAKNAEGQEESKKTNSLDQIRKEIILSKLIDKPKGRRSSLNIDMKKTVGSFYGTEKSDGNSKSHIDKMIENIKLTIAKSIESKIFGPEKGLGLAKNFDIPKIEEIIAPLSTEPQKTCLEETEEDEKPNVSKSENDSESSDNSVPKVADTAKEIEKLVMGDVKPVKTQSQNTQKDEPANNEAPGEEVADPEPVEENAENPPNNEDQQEEIGENAVPETSDKYKNPIDNQSKNSEDSKKSGTLRKSPRNVEKAGAEPADSETSKKSSKPTNNESQKSDEVKESMSKDSEKISNAEEDDVTSKMDSTEALCNDIFNDHPDKVSDELLTIGKESQEEATGQQGQGGSNSEQRVSSPVSEEPETLESISREVEKLVAQDEATEKSNTNTKGSAVQEPECSSETESHKNENEAVSTESAAPETEKLVASSDEIEQNESSDPVGSAANAKEEVDETLIPASSDLSPTGESSTAVPAEKKDTKEADVKEDDQCPELSRCDNVPDPNETKIVSETAANKSQERKSTAQSSKEEEQAPNEKDSGEQKSISEENKRVLRARDKQRKQEGRQTSRSRENVEPKIKIEDETPPVLQPNDADANEEKSNPEESKAENSSNTAKAEMNNSEPLPRTRRSREVKKRKEDAQPLQQVKSKRPKRDLRKSDQQNKEETLLDNEVAKINENNRTFFDKFHKCADRAENFRGFSEGGRSGVEKVQNCEDNTRSKSENDLTTVNGPGQIEREAGLSEKLPTSKKSSSADLATESPKDTKSPEIAQKDLDEASTSGESLSSITLANKILETPEDKAKKESILRLLGLESLEKAAERLSHQKARKEQQYTGTLKTVIRVQNKDKEKDKRRSRSPLKMVLKQGRADGEGDSLEFYTIQKEFGTSGLGDSSSGANRKFTTNHRHSCDEDNEEAPPKDRQSLVIPEKSSSFSIHPGRLCADVCCYCFGKFGSLDTPMHLAQMKSDERRKKILNIERHLTKDSCLCDACYRHVDRKANTSPTNMQSKPQKQHRQLMVSKCSARECRDPARHHVKRRWLLKIKAGLQNQVNIDWESSQHTSMSFCVSHYSKIERFLTCALCKRRLARNHTHQLANSEVDELTERLSQQGIPVILVAGTFVCKLCRYFTQLQLKYKDVENMSANHRSFFKSYRKRILHFHDVEVLDNEDEDSSQSHSSKEKEKDKRKKAKCAQPKNSSFKSASDGTTTNSTSEKSTPELSKNEEVTFEAENENQAAKDSPASEPLNTDVRYLDIESTVEKLKKRKMLDLHSYTPEPAPSTDVTNEVVEILAMDKEVTLTRLPKRPKTTNDIAPVVQRLGANPSISVRTLFPGEEEMNLHANIEFANVREITPQGWEKCATMIQYDRDTRLLWQELQRPYGNQSSFLRHLILLEKYYRSGDLVLAPNASRNAINYSTSVQNRLISFEGPEKMDDPIMEPIPATEYNNSRRLSGGYVVERDRLSLPSSVQKASMIAAQSAGSNRVFKLNPGVSIIKKPPPNLQRLSLPSSTATNGTAKRKEQAFGQKGNPSPSTSGGKVFQLTEPDFRRLQNLKKQKQLLGDKQQQQAGSPGGLASNSPPMFKSATQYQKAQIAAQTQFQKHLRMQQEMLNRQSRGDFEPLICDMRSLANENSPTQNLIHNLNLPKSIQVTTKPPNSNPIPILPKIPKSLTVIPQTVTRPADK